MKLLVTMRTANAVDYDEPRQAISADWIGFCKHLNIFPILVPLGLASYDAFFELKPDGLLLTGGDNVGPLSDEAQGFQPTARDIFEHQLIKRAIDAHLPILGVCRGLHILNTYFGGTLTRKLNMNHVGAHEITFIKSMYRYKKGSKLKVNSFHHHGVLEHQLAREFDIIATSSDGCVEYIEHTNLPITAINWHPERLNTDAKQLDHNIFTNRFAR